MDGIQPQAVDVVLPDPVEGIGDDEVPDAARVLAVVVHGLPPGGPVPVGEVGAELRQVVAFRARGGCTRRPARRRGRARDRRPPDAGDPPARRTSLRGEEPDAVVAPVPRSGKARHRHELDGGDAQRLQPLQARNDGLERSLRRERAHVDLVQHHLPERKAAPAAVRPGEQRSCPPPPTGRGPPRAGPETSGPAARASRPGRRRSGCPGPGHPARFQTSRRRAGAMATGSRGTGSTTRSATFRHRGAQTRNRTRSPPRHVAPGAAVGFVGRFPCLHSHPPFLRTAGCHTYFCGRIRWSSSSRNFRVAASWLARSSAALRRPSNSVIR